MPSEPPRPRATTRGVRWLLWLGLVAFALLVLVNLFGLFHIETEQPAFDLCLFHRVTGADCPGCGMGRSLVHLSRGDFTGSFRWHPFGVPFLLGAIALVFFPARLQPMIRRLAPVCVVALLSWWLLTRVI